MMLYMYVVVVVEAAAGIKAPASFNACVTRALMGRGAGLVHS